MYLIEAARSLLYMGETDSQDEQTVESKAHR